jgi:glutamate carboxypeptidase
MCRLPLIAVLIFCAGTASAQLTKTELQILKNVEKSYEESVAFLEKTVNINSGTYNVEGVKKVGLIYKEFLDQLGFTTK